MAHLKRGKVQWQWGNETVPWLLNSQVAGLGFQDVFHWSREDTPPWTFAQVCRGNFFVYLCQGAQGGPGMWMYLNLASPEDLAALYQEYQAHAVKITQPPTDQPWGMREMLIEDVDGHILRIGTPQPHK